MITASFPMKQNRESKNARLIFKKNQQNFIFKPKLCKFGSAPDFKYVGYQ